MRNINDVLKEINHLIDQHVLEDFIARGWVRPVRGQTDYMFDDIDVSRIHLICDLHITMEIDIDAMDVILSLMDQLYQNKARLNKVMKVIENQPDDIRDDIIRRLKTIE